MLIKNQQANKSTTASKEVVSESAIPQNNIVNSLGFNVQTNRITSRNETYLKIKGTFKIEVENNGDVDIIIFGGYKIPSYAKKIFTADDSVLVFKADTSIEYAPLSAFENIDILLTTYTK
jgi:hypothetical protein